MSEQKDVDARHKAGHDGSPQSLVPELDA